MRYIDWFADGSVLVVDLALACCGVETGMAVPPDARTGHVEDVEAPGVDGSVAPGLAAPDRADPLAAPVVVAAVSGTVSRALAPAVAEAVAGLRARARRLGAGRVEVVAFGACACAGGPYWDSWSVANGASLLPGVEVDHWVPGCPPDPEDFAGLVAELRGDRPVLDPGEPAPRPRERQPVEATR